MFLNFAIYKNITLSRISFGSIITVFNSFNRSIEKLKYIFKNTFVNGDNSQLNFSIAFDN